MYRLVIGNRNYSSWSLRGWLYLRESGLDFDVDRIALFRPDSRDRVAAYSPAGRVPILCDGEIRVWDSMAIIEYLRAKEAGALGWPAEPAQRAHALSISHEMHSGFLALRAELPQNIRGGKALDRKALSTTCQQQVDRIEGMWVDCHEHYGSEGPWLFGEFSIADVIYAPVAMRFASYSIALDERAQGYVDAMRERASMQEWRRDAEAESESFDFIDELKPLDETPLVLG